jgi:hypothetical protein
MWAALDVQITREISELDGKAEFLTNLANLPAANREQIMKNLVAREAAGSKIEEYAELPIQMLPYPQNARFYGREIEMRRINQALDWSNAEKGLLRTFTIYGKRGIGKTEIALEYAYSNPAKFDAIFWVACETSLSLRQSFTDIAKAAKLPGADTPGRRNLKPTITENRLIFIAHDEENHLAVLQWLKKTS